MGADFIYSALPLCRLTEDRLAIALAHIESLKPDDIKMFVEITGRDTKNDEELKSDMADLLRDYNQYQNSRDCGYFEVRGFKYIISGGMSWGDDPTDSCTTMDHIRAIPGIWEMLERWSDEDGAAAKQKSADATTESRSTVIETTGEVHP